jgi:hypothetical protein
MPDRRYFLLVSQLSGCALGPEGDAPAVPGVRLVTVARNEKDDRQAWYSDPLTGTIRNKISDLCISLSSVEGGSSKATLQRYEAGKESQQFVLTGNVVKYRDGRVLDISGGSLKTGIPICVYKNHGGRHQLWDVVDHSHSLSHTRPRILADQSAGPVVEEYAKLRNVCVIINNHFSETRDQRHGTDVDATALRATFSYFGFVVVEEPFKDLTATQMTTSLENALKAEKKDDIGCFVCVILTHGYEKGILCGNDYSTVEIDKLASIFNGDKCEKLVGKPKLFFIQACRGNGYDAGVKKDALLGRFPESKVIPVEADFLLAYCVTADHFATRDPKEGSCFIQALCNVLKEHPRGIELMQLMTLVNKRVADYVLWIKREDQDKERVQCKQMPCFVSTITKHYYFRPKN